VIPVVHQRAIAESDRTADDLGVSRPAQGGRAALAFIHALASEWRHAPTLPEPDRRPRGLGAGPARQLQPLVEPQFAQR
jgi:hypothetical protein